MNKLDFTLIEEKNSVYVEITNVSSLLIISLFGHLGEAILSSPFRSYTFNFAKLGHLTSNVFGVLVNLINKANELSKDIIFVLDESSVETAYKMNLNKIGKFVVEVKEQKEILTEGPTRSNIKEFKDSPKPVRPPSGPSK